MNKSVVIDRRELSERLRALRYQIMEDTVEVLMIVPTKEADRLVETLLDTVKGIEKLVRR